jgi:thiol-disulfide isomerase/thioredoxin
MKSKFIGLVIVIILFVVGLGVFMNKNTSIGKYDDFAKSLVTEGAKFYGAFWCPHCLAEKALFGSSKRYLPYIECSNPDNTQTQICIDNKIENYPTWTFRDGITLLSKSTPTICEISPGKAGEESICAQVASKYYRTWIFPEHRFSIKSPTDPVVKDGVWKFEVGAKATGEIPLEFLAQQIGYTLPK